MKLVFPLNDTTVTSPFGMRNGSLHNGTDFRASVGTPIYAPASGTVKSIYQNNRGGNQLILDHGKGYTTGYAHLDGYNVTKGQKVKRGDLIAYTGNTGIGTGPHLHFTVKHYGDTLDPMMLLVDQAQIEEQETKIFNWQNIVAIVILIGIVIYLYKKL